MLQIRITQPIDRMAEDYATTVFDGVSPSPKDNLQTLKTNLPSMTYTGVTGVNHYQDYIQNIIDHYDEILRLQPQYFKTKKYQWFRMLTNQDLSEKFDSTSFADHVSKAMRYGDLVRQKMRGYYERLGIRACIYCNAQYAATFTRTSGEVRSQYQIDHNFPQTKYPFLCTSFFNLVPSCSTCNQSRSNNEVLFQLYSHTGLNMKPFRFEIPADSLVEYSVTKNKEKLEIKLVSNRRLRKPDGLLANHQNRFHIDELYTFFKQEARDILWKSEIFDANNRTMLAAALRSPVTKSQADSVILGFDVNEAQIHNAPLNMMRQDIAREIGLIV